MKAFQGSWMVFDVGTGKIYGKGLTNLERYEYEVAWHRYLQRKEVEEQLAAKQVENKIISLGKVLNSKKHWHKLLELS